MSNSKHVFQNLVQRIAVNEDKSEKEAIGLLIMEDLFGVTRMDVQTEKSIELNSEKIHLLDTYVSQLNEGLPLQQVLGYAYFFGRKFFVNNDVLIPRPETEELVKLGLDFLNKKPTSKVLDIGTGSGCIPITIALEKNGAHVLATDVSEKALEVAKKNALDMKANVHFAQSNILEDRLPDINFDLIISNPPYITQSEKIHMQPQVVDHEPHLALFVDGNDPLLFYRAIASQSGATLLPGGMVAVEINYHFGKEVAGVFETNGLKGVNIIKDTSGKDRFVTALK